MLPITSLFLELKLMMEGQLYLMLCLCYFGQLSFEIETKKKQPFDIMPSSLPNPPFCGKC